MATHSSVLAWRLPGMGEPRGLPSLGSHRVRHDWSDLAAAAAAAVGMKWYLMGFDMGSVANDSEHLTVNGHVSILFEEMSFQILCPF